MYPSEAWYRSYYGDPEGEGMLDLTPDQLTAAGITAAVRRLVARKESPMRVVSLISGGMDSTVLAYELAAQGELAALISFNYNQLHKKELDYARQTAMRLHIPHEVIDLKSIAPLLKGSALTDHAVKVPTGHYAAENMKATVVPNRNAIMLSIAYAWAISLKADAVAFAAHSGDHEIYPDCREPFIAALQQALNLGNEWDGAKHILSPYVGISKADIVVLGTRLDVPFELTWSCYGRAPFHCGRCGTCVERAEAFFLAGVQDPTTYADPTFWRDAVASRQQQVPDSNAATTEARWALGGGE
jgi:7-cyano-7-deazaguanine synthase